GHGSVSVPVANLAACYLETGELDLAEQYAMESLQRARKENDQMIESAALQHLGTIARRQGRLEEALTLLRQSLNIYRRTRETIHTAEALLELHLIHLASGDFPASLARLEEALAMAEEAGDLALQARVCLELGEVWKADGDLGKSLDYYRRRTNILATIEMSERERMLRAIDVQIEADRSVRERELYRALSQQLEEKAKQLTEAYSSLNAVSELGRTITATQDLTAIFAHAHAKLQELMPAEAFGVGIYDDDENAIVYYYLVEDGKDLGDYSTSMSSTDSLAVACYRRVSGFIVNSPLEDVSHTVKNVSTERGGSMLAAMFHPLQVEGETIGVISVQSRREHAYSERSLEVLGLLASYLAIAIRNAEKSHELQALNRRLGELSNRDGLTGIANRRRFDQFLQDTWNGGIRHGFPVSLILVDIDCFKQYNDHYGHLQGDETIKIIANTIQSCVYRRTDLVARYGGDEFVVVLGDTSEEGARVTADKIEDAIIGLGLAHEASLVEQQVTLSIGVATTTPGRGSASDELIAACDRALYSAKNRGRNRICVAGSA
ncbi:MAG TPA: diguanylate cyclase, partial [Bacillota bacterium]|nr:diguanylate cyclase [Bacillota bacterium]